MKKKTKGELRSEIVWSGFTIMVWSFFVLFGILYLTHATRKTAYFGWILICSAGIVMCLSAYFIVRAGGRLKRKQYDPPPLFLDRKVAEELIQKQKEYIDFLDKQLTDTHPFNIVHGFRYDQVGITEGIVCRNKIKELTEKLYIRL